MIHHMTKYPLLSLGTALLTLLASCATLTYEQVNLPTSFKTYGPDYQFRVLNLEEKTTISILDENKEEKSQLQMKNITISFSPLRLYA